MAKKLTHLSQKNQLTLSENKVSIEIREYIQTFEKNFKKSVIEEGLCP